MGRLVKSSILQLWKRRRRKRQKFCTQKKLGAKFLSIFLLILRFLICNIDDFTHAMTSYNKIEWIQRYFPLQPCVGNALKNSLISLGGGRVWFTWWKWWICHCRTQNEDLQMPIAWILKVCEGVQKLFRNLCNFELLSQLTLGINSRKF